MTLWSVTRASLVTSDTSPVIHQLIHALKLIFGTEGYYLWCTYHIYIICVFYDSNISGTKTPLLLYSSLASTWTTCSVQRCRIRSRAPTTVCSPVATRLCCVRCWARALCCCLVAGAAWRDRVTYRRRGAGWVRTRWLRPNTHRMETWPCGIALATRSRQTKVIRITRATWRP